MVGIIKNLFGGKNNYYAELDDDQASKTAASQHTEPQAASTAASPVKEQANKKEEAAAQPQPTPTAAAPPAPAPVQNSNKPPENPLAGETFAPTYLVPKSTMPRRRPGVNMGQFLDMAREVQVPRNQ